MTVYSPSLGEFDIFPRELLPAIFFRTFHPELNLINTYFNNLVYALGPKNWDNRFKGCGQKPTRWNSIRWYKEIKSGHLFSYALTETPFCKNALHPSWKMHLKGTQFQITHMYTGEQKNQKYPNSNPPQLWGFKQDKLVALFEKNLFVYHCASMHTATLQIPAGSHIQLAFDKNSIATLHDNRCCYIWNDKLTPSSRCELNLGSHLREIKSFCIQESFIATCSTLNRIDVWKWSSAEHIMSHPISQAQVEGIRTFNIQESTLVLATENRVQAWDLDSRQELSNFSILDDQPIRILYRDQKKENTLALARYFPVQIKLHKNNLFRMATNSITIFQISTGKNLGSILFDRSDLTYNCLPFDTSIHITRGQNLLSLAIDSTQLVHDVEA